MIIKKIIAKGEEISILEGTDRLQYLIDIAKDAEPLEAKHKIEQNKIVILFQTFMHNLWL